MNALNRTNALPAEAPQAPARLAAEWFVRKNDGLTPGEQQRFDDWIRASPAHQRAFAMMEETWGTLNEPRRTGLAAHLERNLARRRIRRHRRHALLAAGLGMAAVIVFAFLGSSRPAAVPSPPTVVVRPDLQTLADGTAVELKAGARIDVSFSPEQRAVRLWQGEALFRVAKDPTRPFVVTAGAVAVRAVGTAFAVSHEAEHVAVLVTEGRVAVERQHGPAVASGNRAPDRATYMEAGDRLVVPNDSPATAPLAVTTVSPAQIAAGLAWRGKRVEFTGTTVAEAIALFNRENAVELAAGDAAIARLQLSGIFWADDPEGFVRLLESGMNVRAERSNRRIILHSH